MREDVAAVLVGRRSSSYIMMRVLAGRSRKGEGLCAIVEVCPPPRIEAMAFWVAVSKSVEGGFRSE